MNAATPLAGNSELAAALLQAAITTALAALCGFLFQRYRKPYLAWWSVAWTLYLLRLAAIISFVTTQQRAWLYWHQVVTGWTALALLAAALVFAYGHDGAGPTCPWCSFLRSGRTSPFTGSTRSIGRPAPRSPSSASRRSGPAGSSWRTAAAWRRAARRSWVERFCSGACITSITRFSGPAGRGRHGGTTSTSSS